MKTKITEKENSKSEIKIDAPYLGVGISIGLMFGVAFDNIGLGVSMGVVFGLCLGTISGSIKNK